LLVLSSFCSGCISIIRATPVAQVEEVHAPTLELPTQTSQPFNPCYQGVNTENVSDLYSFTAAYTPDGLRLYRPRELPIQASALDGVEIDKDSALLYALDTNGALQVFRASEEYVEMLGDVFVDGLKLIGLRDVDAYRLEDGSVRIVYLVNSNLGSLTYLAESDDEQNFHLLREGLSLEQGLNWSALSFIQLTDRSWLLAVQADEYVRLWRSPDGILYIPFNELSFGGEPEFALALRGKVRLYFNDGKIVSYTSSDNGEKWKKEQTFDLSAGARLVVYIPVTRLFLYAVGD
jgi:hypothetical protein